MKRSLDVFNLNVSIHNTSPHIGFALNHGGNYASCFVLISNRKQGGNIWRGSDLEQLLNEALSRIDERTSASQIALKTAEYLQRILLRRASEGKLPDSLEYTGIVISESSIFVSWAGSSRVHLLHQGKLVSSTAEHNLITDFQGDDKLRQEIAADSATRRFAELVITRVLGKYADTVGAESVTWKSGVPFSLLICSEVVHDYRPAAEYVYEIDHDPGSQFKNPTDLGICIRLAVTGNSIYR